MVCHQLADFIMERGQATTEEITQATGVPSKSVGCVVKRAVSRGRMIERKSLGVYNYAPNVPRVSTTSTP
jgi:hypothetical protein